MSLGHATVRRLLLDCEAIDGSGRFRREFTGRGGDVSPVFHLQNVPETAQSLSIILRDESHPLFGSMTHWLIWNLPVDMTIEGNIPRGAHVRVLGAVQGIAYGWHRYRGPKPPLNTTHRYVFTVLALGRKLQLPTWTTYRRFMRGAGSSIVASGQIAGIFE